MGAGVSAVILNDALKLSDLAYKNRRVPYHLINTTINLFGTTNPGLRGRRSDFFLLSPLYCGSRTTGYIRTAEYERDRINLASAMAVSGAAANPQYGRATSPALAFLMTLLNVRLGVWAENPLYSLSRLRKVTEARRLWPVYLLLELFSCADEHRNLVNLSDGGHIDNLGVYELLRRRCRVVIASDATADPEHSFSDLVQLLRMARIDLGVHITDLQLDPLIPSTETGLSKNHVVSGKILYPVGIDKYEEGTFIYVKSGLIARDPYDLLSYRREHPGFPQESTVDQFFDETQLESYRELGYQSGRELRDLVRNRAIAGLAS